MPSRREFLTACGFGVGGLGTGALLDRGRGADSEHTAGGRCTSTRDGETAPASVAPDGATQPGVAHPRTPQPFVLLAVADLAAATDESTATGAAGGVGWLAALGERILALYDETTRRTRDGGAAGDLTATVGVGPGFVRRMAGHLPVGTEDLPMFAGDTAIASQFTGGDVCVQLCASEPSELHPALDRLLAPTVGVVPQVRWLQAGFRGAGENGVSRNPIGFLDGLTAPAGDEQLDEHIWLPADAHGPQTAGATIMVVRRLRVDVSAFRRLAVDRQEAIVGRRRADGAPLSAVYAHLRRDAGADADPGEPTTVSPEAPVDLEAKSADGEYLIAPDAHVRAAHPSTTGSGLMLRRSYSYDNGIAGAPPAARADAGLLFISFQRDLRTFVATQHRLDERDALGEFITPTASGTFLVLPGFDRSRPLGATMSRRHD